MKNTWLLAAAVAALSVNMFADTVGTIAGNNGAFYTMPSGSTIVSTQGASGVEGTPFWNDFSTDTTTGCGGCVNGELNVGELLTQSGNFSAANLNINVLGTNTVADDYTTSTGADPSAFDFVSNSTAYAVSLLYANSILNYQTNAPTTVLGLYDETTGLYDQLYSNAQGSSAATVGPTDTITFASLTNQIANGDTYELYADVCYAQTSPLPNLCNMYYSDTIDTPNTGAASSGLTFAGGSEWDHFALFELANNQGYVIGFEDTNQRPGTTYGYEADGDFNDLVIEIMNVPEPASMGLMGLGLAALGFLGRRRFAKK